MDFRWNPTDAQKALFEEWRAFTIGYLVSCKEGVNIRSIASFVGEHVGEEVPFQKMGFKSINTFLYAMNESIEVRKIDFKLFIFIRENAIPQSLIHVRQLVNGQAKDKGCKTKSGVIKRPTKSQSMYCRAEELLSASQYRPPSSTSTYAVNHRPVVVPQSSYSGRRPTTRGSYAGSRPNNFSGPPRPTPRSSPMPPRLQNRNNTTTSRPSSSYAVPIRRSVQPISSSVSSSTASNYVYVPPKPSSSGKENVPKPAVMDSSRDSWSTLGTSTRTVTAVGPLGNSAVASSQAPIKYRHIEGLVDDNDDDLGYSDDSDDDGYDYCGGPVKKLSKGTDNFETFKVTLTTTPTMKANQPAASSTISTSVSEKVAAPTPLKSASSSVQAKPVSSTTSQSASTSYPSRVPSTPKQVIVTSNVSSSSSTVRSIPEPAKLPETEAQSVKRQSSVPKPIRTAGLDSENAIYQKDILKNGAVRIMLNFPKITFPTFFRGGSVKANMGLKAYLASLGKC